MTREPQQEEDLRRDRDLGDTTRFDAGDLQRFGAIGGEKVPVVIVLRGREAGLVVPLERDETTIGRSSECDIVLSGRDLSRVHLRLERTGENAWTLIDTGSSNGTFVNSQQVRRHALVPDDQIQIGLETILAFDVASLADVEVRQSRYEESIRDPLTGILNRRNFISQLTYYVHVARTHHEPLSVVLFDVDHFKEVNDRYGHPAGDLVIQAIATCVADTVRPDDPFCRYGGEEFALIVNGADAADAQLVAERMRRVVGRLKIPVGDEQIAVTVSCGISTLRRDSTMSLGELMEEADANLYRAKRNGRNRTVGVELLQPVR